MKNTIKQLAAIATLAMVFIGINLIVSQEVEPTPLLKQAYRLVISDSFEGYQYEPINGTTVVFYLEKVTNDAGKEEWRIQQIAGPWGNSVGLVNPDVQFDKAFANQFMIAFQEATRVALWRSKLTHNFEWTARTIDVSGQISNRKPQQEGGD